MLLSTSSPPALNSLVGIRLESELNSRKSVQFTQLHVAGNGDGNWVHHPRFERTLSEADSNSQISIGFQSAGDTHEESGKKFAPAIETHRGEGPYVSGRRNEDLMGGEIFEGTGVGLVSNRGVLRVPAIETHRGEGSYVSGRRNEDLMGGEIFEGTGVGLVSNRGVLGSKTEAISVNGGVRGGTGGGRRFGGRGGGYGSDSNSRDAYYKKMLQADPGNPLLLTNYARFLQEVQHDLEKAEEYYGRAIVASPGDGDVLSLYANFIWDVHKDAARAECYYNQAVEAAPDDCNVLGSYAHFLWNAEGVEEEQDASQQKKMASLTYYGTPTIAAT